MKILAIDDNRDNLTVLGAVVADRLPGAVLLSASNGGDGIEIARAADPDVILLDIVMPGMDGYEVCRRLKQDETLAAIPVLFLTAIRTDRDSRVRALEAGAEGFLSKPFDEVELTAQIRAMAKVKQANRFRRMEKEQLEALVAERTRELEEELLRRTAVEEQLRHRGGELETILDILPAVVWIGHDPDCRRITGNRAANELTGVPAGANVSQTMAADGEACYLRHLDAQGREMKPGELPIQRAIATGKPVANVEMRFSLADGRLVDVYGHAAPLFDGQNRVRGAVAAFTDITDRKRAEDDAKAIARQWQATFDAIRDAVWILDRDFRIVQCNKATEAFLGRSFAELIGTECWKVFHKTETPPSHCLAERLKRSLKRETYEDKIGDLWYFASADPIFDAEGKLAGLVHVVSDITDRKTAEGQIRQNESRLRGLVNILQYHAETTQEFLDYALNEAISLTGSRFGYIYFYREESRQFVLNSWSKDVMGECGVVEPQTCYGLDATGFWGEAVRQGKPVILNDFPAPHALKKGYPEGHVPLTKFMTVPVFHDGGIVAVVGVANKAEDYNETDVLQLTLLMDAVWKSVDAMRVAEALRESERRFRRVYEDSPVAYHSLDGDGKLLDVNPAWLSLLGYAREEVLGRPLGDFMTPESRDQFVRTFHDFRQSGCSNGREYRMRRGDRGIVTVAADGVFVRDERGNPLFTHCVLHNITERKAMEDAVLEKERFLSDIIENSGALVFVKDRRGRYEMVNHKWEEAIGITREMTLGKTDEILFPGPDGEQFHRNDCEVMETGVMMEREEVLQAPSGTRYFLSVKFPIRNREGVVSGVCGMATEITGRKTDELRLRAALAEADRFRRALDQVPSYIYMKDTRSRYTYGNQAVLDLFGCSAEELSGRDDAEFFPPETVGRLRGVDARVLAGEKTKEDIDIPFEGGRRVYLEVKTPIVSDDNPDEVLGILGISTDITETKQQEWERERLMTAIEQAAEIIIITDPQGAIQYINPAFEKATGYSRGEVIGGTPRILKSGRQPNEFYRELWDTITGGGTWTGRFVNRRKNGELYTEEATISPVRDASGKIVNYVAVKRDITHELALEDQIRQSQKMEAVGQLAGGVAHDFNNILQSLMGRAQLLRPYFPPDTEQREDIEEILRGTERAASLTRQLLTFSRRQLMQPETLDLNTVAGGLLKMLRRIISEDIKLEWIPGHPLSNIRADVGMVEQVVMNLCVNARDAMQGGGVLTIETKNMVLDGGYCADYPWVKPGDFVMLSVTDTGCGMDGETLGHIFEPFFTTKEPGRGTGLGLATVYGILRQHGGMANVYSEPGRGTVFKVYFPATTQAVEEKPAAQAGVNVCGTETILVAEDDDMVRKLALRVLRRSGYTVLEARDGAEALKLFAAGPNAISLLFLDVVMPNMGGKEALEKIRAIRPGVPALFSSGYSENTGHTGFVLDEGFQLLQKPYTPEMLLRRVRELLDKSKG